MGESFFYLVGAALVVIALLRGRRGGHSIKARDISNSNVINGDTSGPVVQSSSPAASGTGGKAPPDRVAWVIGLTGAALSGAQLIVSLVK